MSKSILESIKSCFVQKTAPKNTKYSRIETILKIGLANNSPVPICTPGGRELSVLPKKHNTESPGQGSKPDRSLRERAH